MPSARPQRRDVATRNTPAGPAARPAAEMAVGNVPNQALVAELATRFRQPLDLPDLPLVVVNRIAPTRSIHIVVIWDKWKELTIPERGRVIADAFATAFPHEQGVVRLTMGLKPGEALSQGYLRYQIIPLVRPVDHVTTKQVKDAMASAGGVLMQVGNDQQLRFATRGQAEEAYRRLLEKINKPIWTLSEETSTSEVAE